MITMGIGLGLGFATYGYGAIGLPPPPVYPYALEAVVISQFFLLEFGAYHDEVDEGPGRARPPARRGSARRRGRP
jgi:hypothetical protein